MREEIITLLKIRTKHLRMERATKRYQSKDTKLMSGRIKENLWLLDKLKQNNINNIISYLESKVKHIKKMKAYTRQLIERGKQ